MTTIVVVVVVITTSRCVKAAIGSVVVVIGPASQQIVTIVAKAIATEGTSAMIVSTKRAPTSPASTTTETGLTSRKSSRKLAPARFATSTSSQSRFSP